MSEGMIIRRGGGGGGFDPTGAVLKVVTSAGCSVNVSGTSYSRTQTDAEGFPRSSDANVVEHFFNIPSTAFGTITVTATNTYGTNTKTLTVNTAGKVYEQLCGGINIILNSTFGLQSGYVVDVYVNYSERDKTITEDYGSGRRLLFTNNVPVSAYSKLRFTGTSGVSTKNLYLYLYDNDDVEIAEAYVRESGTATVDLHDKFYPTAQMYFDCTGTNGVFSEIVLL